MNRKNKPFYFIGNILELDIKSPVVIIYGYKIKKANSDQIKVIKAKFEKVYLATQRIPIEINPYESNFISTGEGNCYKIEYPKNINQWKYWILELDCGINEFEEQKDNIAKNIKIIDAAFLISDFNIQLL